MDLQRAREFLHEHHRGVLATRRSGGGIQQSPVIAAVDGEGRVVISSRETAYKVRNLRRDPWAQLCAFPDRFFGEWIYAEGEAEILSLPEAMEPLIDYYKRFPGENPDWDEYRARMESERRVLIRIELSAAGPDVQG
ncbi:MAG: PPOX class F420-dependent oxidoreductase [Thermoleophilia bacterium]|nr:PPOX class F420-dependent oxidoreductase [Thermoleophilia bacterium]